MIIELFFEELLSFIELAPFDIYKKKKILVSHNDLPVRLDIYIKCDRIFFYIDRILYVYKFFVKNNRFCIHICNFVHIYFLHKCVQFSKVVFFYIYRIFIIYYMKHHRNPHRRRSEHRYFCFFFLFTNNKNVVVCD